VRIDAVFDEGSFYFERGRALETRVRHDFVHVHSVASQHALLGKLHFAMIARVRTLASVRQHMALKVALAGNLYPTQRTRKADFALRVHVSDVAFEATVEREAARTHFTLESADPQVRTHVLAQLGLARERFTAQIADKPSRKVNSAVLFKAAALLESLAAYVANARPDLGKMADAVVAQVRSFAERLAADVASLRAPSHSANRHVRPLVRLFTCLQRMAGTFDGKVVLH